MTRGAGHCQSTRHLNDDIEVDCFRIKIWDRATGAIVYDNQMGAAEDADPTTALGGGSIVIHKEQ